MEAVMTYSQAFFGWLLQTTLIASVIICLVLLIQKILGGKLGPRWCHALWLVLLIRMVLPWAPSSRLSLSNLIPSLERQIQHRQRLEPAEQQKVPSPAQIAETSEALPGEERKSEVALQTPVISKPPATTQMEAKSGLRIVSIRRVLPILWLVGALVIGLYLLMSNFALWRIVKRDRPLMNQSMLELFEECKAQVGVQSLVAVIPSDRVRSPGLFGFVRPRLLLPRKMLDTATTEEMRYVFLHELAHLRRRDIYIGWLTSLLQVLHWFNPLVWFAFYRMRADRELACDALVLSRTGPDKSQEYGGTIVGLLRRFSRSRPLPAMAGILESKSQLERRMTMIALFKKNSYQWSPMAVMLILMLACVSLPDAISTKAAVTSVAETAPPMVLRRIWSDPYSGVSGAPSPDGKYLSYTDWETGDLAIYEIATGTERRLTNKRSWDISDECAYSSIWSPDGKQIAYFWEMDDGSAEIRVIGIGDPKPRILYRHKETEWAKLYDWSPDGEHILACLLGNNKEGKITLVSTMDGSMRALKSAGQYKDWPREMNFSPDGHYIVYSYPQKKDSKSHDISIMTNDGNNETLLVEHPAHDFVLGWAPNGKDILFASDRTGSLGIWLIATADGKPRGIPRLAKQNIQRFEPLGFTKEGSYYFGTPSTKDDVYIATLDQETGTIVAPPQKAIERYEGSNMVATYSPDGKQLAYVYYHNRGKTLCIRSLETGQEREFSLPIQNIKRYCGLNWSKNCRFILISGEPESGTQEIYNVDTQTGEVACVVKRGRSGVWSHDGKAVIYLRVDLDANRKLKALRILERNLESGQEKERYSSVLDEYAPYNMSLSPNGKWLALRCIKPTSLKIMPVSGGEARELPEFKKVATIHKPMVWTADSQYILFSGKEPGGGKHPLYRISVKTGETKKLGLQMNRYYALSAHPDGRRFLISCRESAAKQEFWAMENFLPETPMAQPEPTPTMRQIEIRGRGIRHSSPSFDGKYVSDVDRESGNLVIRDIATGEQWNLTKQDPNSDDFADWSAISPDSTNVIYYWFNAQKEDFDLRVVGLDGSRDRLLWGAREGARSFNMDAWSPNGKYVYGELLREDEPVRLVRVALADGSRHVIKTFDEKRFFTVSSSPDGRYIAYDCAQNKSSSRDIFIYDLEGKTEKPLIRHAANDKLLGWTPDGQHIFFTSDRNGTWDGWLLRIVDGTPVGLPETIKAGIGDVLPIGFTQSGSFYYAFNHQAWNVYTAKLDLDTGEALSEPKPLRHMGKDVLPDWSPDGRHLAYLSQTDRTKPQVIRIRTLATGQERELKTDLPFFRFLQWCPDSQHLLITDFKDRSVVYQLDVRTGEYTALVRLLQSEGQKIRQAELSSDGKTLAYRIRGRGTTNRLVVRDLESGRDKELLQTGGSTVLAFAAGWTLSPNGKKIAFSIREGANNPYALKIISVKTGNVKNTGINGVWQIAWSDDGDHLVFTRNLKELWTVSAEQDEPEKLLEWNEMLLCPSIHPDGQRIAFFSGGYVSEMWMMENFLPESTADERSE